MKLCLYCRNSISDDAQSCPSCAGRQFGPVAEEQWVEITAFGDKRRTWLETRSGKLEYAAWEAE